MRVEEKKKKTNNKTVDLNAIHKLRDCANGFLKIIQLYVVFKKLIANMILAC